MPRYHVRLHIVEPGGEDTKACWHTDVPVYPYERLERAEIERRAVAQAVAAFGPDAAAWTLIDAERKR